jgi:ATP-binding cassette subfamily B protein
VAVQVAIQRVFHLSRINQEQLGEISEHVLGSLQGMATIQGFVAEQSFVDRFEQRNDDWMRIGMKLALIRAGALPLLVLSGGISMFAVVAVGGPMVLDGRLTVVSWRPSRRCWRCCRCRCGRSADAVGHPAGGPRSIACSSLASRWSALRWIGVDLLRGASPPSPRSRFQLPDAPDFRVSWISLAIRRGVIGLFGRTGSGKAHCCGLAPVQPACGSVLVDGHDIIDLDLESWRNRVTMVPQRPFLFSESIAANIALAEDADEARVREAARMAALEQDLQALPDSLDTVGERGITLSGAATARRLVEVLPAAAVC